MSQYNCDRRRTARVRAGSEETTGRRHRRACKPLGRPGTALPRASSTSSAWLSHRRSRAADAGSSTACRRFGSSRSEARPHRLAPCSSTTASSGRTAGPSRTPSAAPTSMSAKSRSTRGRVARPSQGGMVAVPRTVRHVRASRRTAAMHKYAGRAADHGTGPRNPSRRRGEGLCPARVAALCRSVLVGWADRPPTAERAFYAKIPFVGPDQLGLRCFGVPRRPLHGYDDC